MYACAYLFHLQGLYICFRLWSLELWFFSLFILTFDAWYGNLFSWLILLHLWLQLYLNCFFFQSKCECWSFNIVIYGYPSFLWIVHILHITRWIWKLLLWLYSLCLWAYETIWIVFFMVFDMNVNPLMHVIDTLIISLSQFLHCNCLGRWIWKWLLDHLLCVSTICNWLQYSLKFFLSLLWIWLLDIILNLALHFVSYSLFGFLL